MPTFLEQTIHWAEMTAGHFLLMFWWIWLVAVVVTALSESYWIEGRRRRLLERPDEGRFTVWIALQLGFLSPPSRRRIFRQAKQLLAAGVSRAGVLAYLVSAQTVLVWMLVTIVALNGPQPALGQLVAVAAALGVLLWGAARLPDGLWEGARGRARASLAAGKGGAPIGAEAGAPADTGDPVAGVGALADSPLARTGPAWLRPLKSVAGQGYSLWWPLLFGTLGVGFFLALGQSPGYLSLQGSRGPLVQAGNAGAGLLVAYVTGAPLVGNALIAAGLWKAQFLSYAGLSAFYLGTLVMPFALPRYFDLFGPELGKRILWWLAGAILVGALAATAWWWGLHGLAGALGLQDAFHALTDSTLRPNDVPWFHHWFAPEL